MIIKGPKITRNEALFGVFLLVMIANYLAIKLWAYPFLYCWSGAVVHMLYDAAFAFLQLVIAAWVVFKVFTLNVIGVVAGVLIYGLLLKAPEFVSIIFAVGNSCG